MADLNKLITDQFKRGNISHISIIASAQPDGVVFRTSFRGAVGATRHAEDKDPVVSLTKALQGKE